MSQNIPIIISYQLHIVEENSTFYLDRMIHWNHVYGSKYEH